MTDPKWRIVANLGDADPIEHGGAFVLVDETGTHDPELEFWQEPAEDGEQEWRVSRWTLTRCTLTANVVSDNPFHPQHPAWFAETLPDIAECCDHPDLVADLCSENTITRAQAYLSIARYHGELNFDEYPLILNRQGIEARYESLSND